KDHGILAAGRQYLPVRAELHDSNWSTMRGFHGSQFRELDRSVARDRVDAENLLAPACRHHQLLEVWTQGNSVYSRFHALQFERNLTPLLFGHRLLRVTLERRQFPGREAELRVE